MTLPSNIIFPEKQDFKNLEDVNIFLKEYTFTLQRMYENLTQGINGDIRASVYTQRRQWNPTLEGTSMAGSFTYTHRIGWVLRKGLLVDIWFDVGWSSSGGAAGNLYLVLPYVVANSDQIPFSSTLQTSTISYGAGFTLMHINAITNTFRGEIWKSGSGRTTTNVTVVSAGQLIGHLRYLGKQDEP